MIQYISKFILQKDCFTEEDYIKLNRKFEAICRSVATEFKCRCSVKVYTLEIEK